VWTVLCAKSDGQTNIMRLAVDNEEPLQPIQVFNPHEADAGIDWYGNTRLASLVGRDDGSNPAVVHQVAYLIEQYPAALTLPNQFQRLPLHYALDKLPRKVNIEIIRLLLSSSPESASARDVEGTAPLDLCRHWGHKVEVQQLILEAQPHTSSRELYIFRHPKMYAVLEAFQRFFGRYRRWDENEYEVGEEEEAQDLVVTSATSSLPVVGADTEHYAIESTNTLVEHYDSDSTPSAFVKQESDSTLVLCPHDSDWEE
jgi:hypothetical protein